MMSLLKSSKPAGFNNVMNLGSSLLIQMLFHIPKVTLEKLRGNAIGILKKNNAIVNPEILSFHLQENGYQLPRYNDYKYYNPSYSYLRDQYNQIKKSGDFSAWEKFAALLFTSVTGFEPILDVRPGDKSYQFDVVIRNVSAADFSIKWLGDYFALECKYYNTDPVGVDAINHFASKLRYHDFKCGIFFTKTPLSGWGAKAGEQHGKLVQTKIFNRLGLIIFDFSEKDIESILDGKNLIEVLFDKYEQVRLDL